MAGVGPGEVTTRHACKGSQPSGLDTLVIKPSWWAGTAPALPTRRTDPGQGTPPRGQAIHESRHARRTGTILPASPRPATTNTYRRYSEQTDEVLQGAVVGVLSGFVAKCGGDVVGGLLPVNVEAAGPGVEAPRRHDRRSNRGGGRSWKSGGPITTARSWKRPVGVNEPCAAGTGAVWSRATGRASFLECPGLCPELPNVFAYRI